MYIFLDADTFRRLHIWPIDQREIYNKMLFHEWFTNFSTHYRDMWEKFDIMPIEEEISTKQVYFYHLSQVGNVMQSTNEHNVK